MNCHSQMQASGEIEMHFTSKLAEPRLVVFEESGDVVQMFLCAESKALMEIPSTFFIDGVSHLMAAYYVFDVQYPKVCQSHLYFFQDVLMDKADTAKPRPVRYTSYIRSLDL